jgi:hypothetical protein
VAGRKIIQGSINNDNGFIGLDKTQQMKSAGTTIHQVSPLNSLLFQPGYHMNANTFIIHQ